MRGVEDAGSARSGGRGTSRVTHRDGNGIINGLSVGLIEFVLFCLFLFNTAVFGIHLPDFLVGTHVQSFVALSNAMLVKSTRWGERSLRSPGILIGLLRLLGPSSDYFWLRGLLNIHSESEPVQAESIGLLRVFGQSTVMSMAVLYTTEPLNWHI
jgi:hypothetical protein